MAYLDNNGLLYFWQQIKTKLAAKADSTDIPTATSQLTNDSGFITSADVPEGAAASTTTPKMDGTAATGSETAFARGDHVHPSDTSRQAKITASGILKGNGSGTVSAAVSGTDYQAPLPSQTGNSGKYLTTDGSDLSWGTVDAFPTQSGNSGKYLTTNGSTVSWGSISIPGATATTPKMDGTAAVGSETTWAKGDHVHPTDTSRAPLASPGLTGTPTAPTAAAGTNTTQIATTAFVTTAVANAQTGMAACQGSLDAQSTLTNASYKNGWYWFVGTAGTYAGEVCEVGDMVVAKADKGSSYSASDFAVIQRNLDLASITNAQIDTILAS